MRFSEIAYVEKNYFNSQLNEANNFFQIKKFKFSNFKQKKIKDKKFFLYLPMNLQKKIYKRLLKLYLKNITFKEIDFLLKLNIFTTK